MLHSLTDFCYIEVGATLGLLEEGWRYHSVALCDAFGGKEIGILKRTELQIPIVTNLHPGAPTDTFRVTLAILINSNYVQLDSICLSCITSYQELSHVLC